MTPDSIDAATDWLFAHRCAPSATTGLPDGLRPPDLAAAHRVQTRLHGRMAAAGWGGRAGWKIGCTTAVMQRFLGIGQPCRGGMTEARIFAGEAALAPVPMHRPGVECEIGLRLGRDLPVQAQTTAALADAVEAVFGAIEIVDDRYADFAAIGVPGLVADDFFHVAAVTAQPNPNWRDIDLSAATGRLLVDGSDIDGGAGAAIMGHPLEALAWLTGDLAASGLALRRGDVVMLGSVAQTRWVPRGTRVEVDFGPLGRAAATI